MSAKTFNTAGPCDPQRHYMLPPERRLENIDRLIDGQGYFVLHAPRQVGKTTAMRALAERLNREGRYAALWVSCEGAGVAGDDVTLGVGAVVRKIADRAGELPEALRPPDLAEMGEVGPLNLLDVFLHRWAERSPLPIVLLLDEFDALLGKTLVAVLQQLRSGYPERPRRFPQCVALIGLRDVRDYRLAAEPGAPTLGTSSPFNVKIESLRLRNFDAVEVAALCRQHQAATGQPFTGEALAQIFELTQGQPWLVNALARQLIEGEVPDRADSIDAAAVERAKEKLILRRDTHLDSLAARLQEPRVRRILDPFLAGELLDERVSQDDLDFVIDLGLLRYDNGSLVIANPIYREVIPRTLSTVLEASLDISRPAYVFANGRLDLEALLEGFRAFWLESAESMLRRSPYSEAAAQLIFMAYLQKVVNGGGFIDREYAVGRGRIDLCLRWPHKNGVERFAFELKVRRDGTDVRARGLDQLADYLERLSLEEGTLVIFDARSDAQPLPQRCRTEEILHAGRRIQLMSL